tara:strand:- start:2459 stop:2851 length:393 start_codon:yes stop_codon:yes gene_type:complete
MSITLTAKKFVEARKMLDEEVEPLLNSLKTPDLPLVDRWAAYTTLVEGNVLTNIESYGDGFVETLGRNLTLYDDFHCERHETMLYTDMYQHILEADGDYQQDLVAARETACDAWREKVLASGTAGFKHDW